LHSKQGNEKGDTGGLSFMLLPGRGSLFRVGYLREEIGNVQRSVFLPDKDDLRSGKYEGVDDDPTF
jgi:hypothetical protein